MKRPKRHLYRIVLSFEEVEDDTFPFEAYNANPDKELEELDAKDEANLNELPWREVAASSLFAGPCENSADFRSTAPLVCEGLATVLRSQLGPMMMTPNDCTPDA